jgi:hypothetical protein
MSFNCHFFQNNNKDVDLHLRARVLLRLFHISQTTDDNYQVFKNIESGVKSKHHM